MISTLLLLAIASEPAKCATTCAHAPLFKDAPELTELDKEVLALCPTNADGAVKREDAWRFFERHYDDPHIQAALKAALRAGATKDTNLAWLTGLWIGAGPKNAFTHVFCGDDWTRDKLGGLHFLPRYATLEAEHKLCFDTDLDTDKNQYVIRYHALAPFSCGKKPIGGFTKAHDALAIIAAAIRAFTQFCAGTLDDRNGIYVAAELGNTHWQIFCGKRNGSYGIATFYPGR